MVAARLTQIRARMANAAARAGRSPSDVRLIAVSKTFPVEAVRAAYDAGHRDFGENRLQELLQKMEATSGLDVQWHLIGHLQSNKARKAAERVPLIHSVDSVDLLRRLEAAAAAAGTRPKLLVQVDLAAEPTKHGAPPETLAGIFEEAQRARAVMVVGLMLLPPLAENPEDARPWFRRLRDERDRLRDAGIADALLRELSMGMSHDFEVAIEEGATMIRVGTALFGDR